jgi:type III secretion system YscQ/HrcQ family protein
MLGGEGTPPDTLRSLTRTERAVIEFLCLSCASELILQTGEPLLRLQTINEQPPWLTSRIRNAASVSTSTGDVWKRGLVASLRIGVGEIIGISRVYLTPGALSSLDETNRRLREAQRISNNVAYRAEELARFARFTPDLGLTILVGQTYLTPQELLELESGDVMVVETPSFGWREQRISGSLFLRVGDADEALITGEALENAAQELRHSVEAEQSEGAQSGSLKMKVAGVNISPPPALAERVKMEEEMEETDNPEALAEGASLIDAVMLTVRVELAARRLGLDELSRLRANQILDLGCKPTDPVDVIVDGRRIARGELVDVEGQLGVRIAQVLG